MSTINGYNVPIVIEKNSAGIDKTYDIYSRLYQDRIIFVTGEIEDEMANAICAQLLFLQSQDPDKQISMYINSPGGVCTSGLAIYDVMKHISCPIATYCIGQACSMAAVLLAAGDKGMRYALPNARIMVHQPYAGGEGKISDLAITFAEGQRLKDILNGILAKSCGKKMKDMEKATDRDNFMSAEEAKKFGLIDDVI